MVRRLGLEITESLPITETGCETLAEMSNKAVRAAGVKGVMVMRCVNRYCDICTVTFTVRHYDVAYDVAR